MRLSFSSWLLAFAALPACGPVEESAVDAPAAVEDALTGTATPALWSRGREAGDVSVSWKRSCGLGQEGWNVLGDAFAENLSPCTDVFISTRRRRRRRCCARDRRR